MVVGSYQNICREVHVEALRQRGIPVVRRISGGGTVYHDLGNVNYTYIVRAGTLDYAAVLSPVIAALNAIGVPARKNRTCDIAIGDLKISGSAQRMIKGRLLHHGTLLFSSDLGVLDQITTHRKNDCFQSRGTQSAICTVTNIREHLASPMTIEEFQDRLLAQMVPPGSLHLTLTAEQEAEVCRLRDAKYCSWEWTWGRTPAFTYEKSGIFNGVPIRVAYQANFSGGNTDGIQRSDNRRQHIIIIPSAVRPDNICVVDVSQIVIDGSAAGHDAYHSESFPRSVL